MDHSVIVSLELLFVCLNFIGLFMEKVTILRLDVLNFIAHELEVCVVVTCFCLPKM